MPNFGGAARGPFLLDESNVDWGQDLLALARWQREHEGEPLYLLYFGNAAPDAYGVSAQPLTDAHLGQPPAGRFAISAHYLAYLCELQAVSGRPVDWLSKYTPAERVGSSTWIYDFR